MTVERADRRVGSIESVCPQEEVAMASLIPFVVSAALLVASPGNGDTSPDNNDQQGQQLTDAQAFSAAADEDALSTAKELMKASALVGRQAVPDGKADCKVVEASFSKLEEIEQQQPPGDDDQPDWALNLMA